MSFGRPLLLLALLALPPLALALRAADRRQRRRAAAFAAAPVLPSVAPRRPGPRRHLPPLLLGIAALLLILAAARPQRSVAVPLSAGQVLLADDVSSSMAATDVRPSREAAAARAGNLFISHLPAAVRVGVLAFNQHPLLLQSPTADHSLARQALAQLHAGGATAIGDALEASLHALQVAAGTGSARRAPAAIVLLSDGTSTTGEDPLVAARHAAAAHVPVYTVSVGTAAGTITVPRPRHPLTVPVPVNGSELDEVARISGGRAFTAGDAGALRSIYRHLAARVGQRHVKRSETAPFAAAGGVLLVGAAGLSLAWFGRLI